MAFIKAILNPDLHPRQNHETQISQKSNILSKQPPTTLLYRRYKEPPVESLRKRGMKAMNLDLDTMEKLEASNTAVQEFEDAAKSGEKVSVWSSVHWKCYEGLNVLTGKCLSCAPLPASEAYWQLCSNCNEWFDFYLINF
eukprot:1137601-Pelagomonas_calceolata.AAC.2